MCVCVCPCPLCVRVRVCLRVCALRFCVCTSLTECAPPLPIGQAAYIGQAAPVVSFSPEALGSLDALLAAFTWRARNAVYTITAEFEALLSSGLPFDDAWNACAVGLVDAARSHCFYVLLSRFAAGIGHIEDAATRAAVTKLARHYALVQVRERGVEWAGVLAPKDVAAVNAAVLKLLADIRPDAVAFVDSFGFADRDLNSAIGRSDGNVYEALFAYAKANPLNKDAFVKRMWETCLKGTLDLKFLAEGKKTQRAAPLSKL